MTRINLLKVAALPGSGSGCQSALPAEVGRTRTKEDGAELFAPGKIVWCTDPVPCGDLCAARPIRIHSSVVLPSVGIVTSPTMARQIADQISLANRRKERNT